MVERKIWFNCMLLILLWLLHFCKKKLNMDNVFIIFVVSYMCEMDQKTVALIICYQLAINSKQKLIYTGSKRLSHHTLIGSTCRWVMKPYFMPKNKWMNEVSYQGRRLTLLYISLGSEKLFQQVAWWLIFRKAALTKQVGKSLQQGWMALLSHVSFLGFVGKTFPSLLSLLSFVSHKR